MKDFTSIDPNDLDKNSIHLIGKEWMLITAGSLKENQSELEKTYNTMTASWGGLGVLWKKPVAFTFIRPQRFTFDFVEKNSNFTLCFFSSEYKEALDLCGRVSGRDTDKVHDAHLTPFTTENGSVAFEEASIILECRKLYADYIKPENFYDNSLISTVYKTADFHRVYVSEITKAWIKK